MKIHFLRHATFILEFGGVRFLVDPMLSPKDALDPVGNSRNTSRFPLVDLPVSTDELTELLAGVEALIVTHTHRDHWDVIAQTLLNKTLPLICQPPDTGAFIQQSFGNILPVETSIRYKDITIHRTGGQHGTGEIGARLGPVSGFVLKHGHETLYIAGDTIWCHETEEAIAVHNPNVIVVNTGTAQFDEGDPITMTASDVMSVIRKAPLAKVIAVHMETVNHCWLKRPDLHRALQLRNLTDHCLIPTNGEHLTLY